MISPTLPSTRSTAVPHQTKISMLKPMWIAFACTNVALSGVRNAGTAGDTVIKPLKRAGINPSTAAACSGVEMVCATSQNKTVSAVIATVAVRGMRSTVRLR